MGKINSPYRIHPNAGKAPTARPERTGRHRRKLSPSALVCNGVFTVVQVWAMIVILVGLRPDGAAKAALACVMAAAVTAVLWVWTELRS